MIRNKWYRRYLRPQEGEAGDTGGGEAIGTGNDARVALLNSIGDSYDQIRGEDLADVNDDGTTSEFVVQRADGGQEDLDPQPADPAPVDPAPADPVSADTVQMITRKVNGKMVTKSLEEWLVDASKVNAADEYLQDAARLRKEALKVADPEQPAPPQRASQPSPEELAAQRREALRKQARAIQMGTEEEAIAALEEVQNLSRTPTLTVEEVSRVADERLKFTKAVDWFNETYSDIVSNPELHRMVLQQDAELIRNGDKRPYRERYEEVGNSVRQWRDNLIKSVAPTPSPEEQQQDELAARRTAKAAAPKPPVSANRAAKPAVEDDGEDDPSAVIAAMAKARGGPQWMQGRQG